MAAEASGSGTSQYIHLAMKLTEKLRTSVSKTLEDLASGSYATQSTRNSGEVRSDGNIERLKEGLATIQRTVSELEKVSVRMPRTNNIPSSLGNSGLLSLHPHHDVQALYRQLVQTYHWKHKLRSQALLSVESLKRHNAITGNEAEGFIPIKRQKTTKKSPPTREELIRTIQSLRQNFPQLEIHCFNTSGVNVLKVVVRRTFKAILTLKELTIETVLVRGIQEDSLQEKDTNVTTPSQHIVFQKITDYANAAVLHYHNPLDPEHTLKAFMKWLSSFNGLFGKKCLTCSKHLFDEGEKTLVPPCWRSYDKLQPYHYSCRP